MASHKWLTIHWSKQKNVKNNQSSLITKEVQKTTMTRSKVRNKFLKTKSQKFKQAGNKQRNICVAMIRKAKKNYSVIKKHQEM